VREVRGHPYIGTTVEWVRAHPFGTGAEYAKDEGIRVHVATQRLLAAFHLGLIHRVERGVYAPIDVGENAPPAGKLTPAQLAWCMAQRTYIARCRAGSCLTLEQAAERCGLKAWQLDIYVARGEGPLSISAALPPGETRIYPARCVDIWNKARERKEESK